MYVAYIYVHMYVYCMYFICMLYVFYMNICYMFSLCMLLICMYEYVVFMNPVCQIACIPLIKYHGNIFIISNTVPSSRQYSFRPNNYTAIKIQRTCRLLLACFCSGVLQVPAQTKPCVSLRVQLWVLKKKKIIKLRRWFLVTDRKIFFLLAIFAIQYV